MGRTKKGRKALFCWLSIRMNTWQNFYQNIRDSSWPECANEHEFTKLPNHIQDEILTLHNGQTFISLAQDDIVDVFVDGIVETATDNFDLEFLVANDFKVFYNNMLEGGGNSVGQRYPLILKLLYPDRIFDSCLEWCSGHGVIGFRLLADGICKNLHFLEMYQPAVNACKKTIANMPTRFANRVSMYETSTLTSLPSDIRFDLIVSNPPHFPLQLGDQLFDIPKTHHHRITVDKEWNTHKDFFANAAKYLADDGVILLQEIYHIDEFSEMIDQGGLKIKNMFAEKNYPLPWYLELTHK
jgi:16S rRNA G966 N2-methylase RsmD